MGASNPNTEGQPGLVPAALFGLCPKCGGRHLFGKGVGGAARFADRCPACGLDYRTFNVGDGPAAFITLIVGALVVALAIWIESKFAPPMWVHVVLWVPVTAGAVLWGLRLGKAALLCAEYQRQAGEAGGKDLSE